MTLNGWFQIAFMLALVIATARPLGLYTASVLQGRPTFLDPVCARWSADSMPWRVSTRSASRAGVATRWHC